jgi:hypothetical protein
MPGRGRLPGASSYKEQTRLKQWGAKVIQLRIEQAKSEFM